MKPDVIVVGSGLAGAWAAKELSARGLAVLVLDAGPAISAQRAADLTPWSGDRRAAAAMRQPRQACHPCYWLQNPELYIDDAEHPYRTTDDTDFVWIRGRQIGGKSLTWGGVTLRFSDHEFHRSGGPADEAWPIDYGDIRAYYDEVERFIGIEGKADGIARLPDGVYLPASPMTPLEADFRKRVESRWHDRRVIHARGVRGYSSAGESMGDGAWGPHTSLHSVLPAAIATGRTELRPDAIVSHLLLSDDGSRVVGVACVERESKKQFEVHGRAVALCASTLESVRIMLNSTHAHHPTGVGNSSGCLGRYIVDHAAVSISGECALNDEYPLFSIGPGAGYGVLLPPIAENFGIWGAMQRGAPNAAGEFGWFFNATVEMSPRRSNCVALDEKSVDAWGIKSLKMDVRYSDAEREELAYAKKYLCHMAEDCGLKVTGGVETAPGGYVHELGGARMGSDPATSVLNPFNQCWDVPNLFVMDGASFVTAGWQNPSLTIMALAARASERLADSLKS
jgi:choline dehydrogenase-like flavoprotein